MKWHARRDSRKIHRIGAIIVALPFLIVLVTGLLLQVKKDVAWIQPVSQEGISKIPSITFQHILEASRSVPEAEITTWEDIDRLDVRPDKGMVKVRSVNHWEIQIDTETGIILQVEYRRSDIIEAMHDGSWFADAAKYWIFLPTGFIVLVLWITGTYMYFIPSLNRRRNEKRISKIKRDSSEGRKSTLEFLESLPSPSFGTQFQYIFQKSDMKKTALILSILLAPTVLNAQIEIGQLKIPSFEAFFNVENTAYWDDIGAFAITGQEYFIPNFPSMINSRNDQLSIELAFKGNLDVGDVRYELTNQFVRQFGQPVAIENTSGFQLSNTGWIIEENDLEFIVAFPRNPNDGKLIILKVGE